MSPLTCLDARGEAQGAGQDGTDPSAHNRSPQSSGSKRARYFTKIRCCLHSDG